MVLNTEFSLMGNSVIEIPGCLGFGAPAESEPPPEFIDPFSIFCDSRRVIS